MIDITRICPVINHLVVLIAVIITGAVHAAPKNKHPQCPPQFEIEPCSCNNDYVAIRLLCQGINQKRLVDVCSTLKKDDNPIKSIAIDDADLHSIPDDTFSELQIDELYITNTNLSVIESKAFAGLDGTLKKLVLSNNQLKEVPADALRHLRSMHLLNLSGNRIGELKNFLFRGLGSLQSLHLADNVIAHLDAFTFGEYFENLTHVYLNQNHLSEVPEKAFSSLHNLEVLELSDNHIKVVTNQSFAGLKKLDELNLSRNKIQRVEEGAFESSRIQSIILKENYLEKLKSTSFLGLGDSTKFIDLSNNLFERVPDQALENLPALRHLDLSQNKIGIIDDQSLSPFGKSLHYLELNHNKIRLITPMALQGLDAIELLMLDHNKLTKIPGNTMVNVLDTIRILDLGENPLTCSCDLQWLKQWLDTVNNLEGTLIEPPTCQIGKINNKHYVSKISCDENGNLTLLESPICGLDCLKSLGSFFSNSIKWYSPTGQLIP